MQLRASELSSKIRGKAILVLWAWYVFGISFIALGRPFLPPKYSFDSDKIMGLSQGRISELGDPSFERIARLYRFFGLADQPILAGIISFTIFAVLNLVVINRAEVSLRKATYFILSISMICGVIYFGQYCKEVVLAAALMLLLAFQRRRLNLILWLATLVSYGLFFRTYWLLISVIFLIFQSLTSELQTRVKKGTYRTTFLVGFSAACLITLAGAIPIFTGTEASQFREVINIDRLGSGVAETAITNFWSGPGLTGQALNLVAIFLSLLIPWPLVASGQIQYVIFGLAISAVWLNFLTRNWWIRGFRSGFAKNTGYFSLIFSVVMVQAVFEPDYGSYLRHLTALLPLMILASSPIDETTEVLH